MPAPSATFRREDFPDLTDPGTLDRFLRRLNTFAKGTEQFADGQIGAAGRKTVQVSLATFGIAAGWVDIIGGSGDVGATIDGVTVTVTWATSDANTSRLLAIAVNGNAALAAICRATASGNRVGIAALDAGLEGNSISLSASGTGVAASGATLKGGAKNATLRLSSPVYRPAAVYVAQAFDVTTRVAVPVSLANPAWSASGSDVVIFSLGTLDAAKTYQVTFEART